MSTQRGRSGNSSQLDGTVVLGAGLAGLGFALECPAARIFEAKEHPGGHAYSHQMGGVFFDEGAHISHTRDADFRALIRSRAGSVEDIARSVVSNRWRGRVLGYPVQNHLHALPPEARTAALIDLVMAHVGRDETEATNYLEWCRSEYGDYLTENFYAVFTEKYWRTPMQDLALDWLGGRLLPSVLPNIIRGSIGPVEETQTTFSTFRYPSHGGFYGFFDGMYDDLNVHCNERAIEIDAKRGEISFESGMTAGYAALASTIPLPDLVRIVKDVPASVVEAAGRLRHTKLLCANIIVDRPSLCDSHWQYVYDAEVEVARVSFPGNLAPGSVPPGQTALQAEVFRRDDEDWDVGELTETVIAQLSDLYDFDPSRDVVMASPLVVPYGYVVSDRNRASAVAHIHDWLSNLGIHCMGLYGEWTYMWSDAAFASGQRTATKVRTQ